MDNSLLYSKLADIFHDVFDDDDLVVTPELTAQEVEAWDSLKHVRLILTVERHFKVKFSAADVGRLKNVGELAALIQAKVS